VAPDASSLLLRIALLLGGLLLSPAAGRAQTEDDLELEVRATPPASEDDLEIEATASDAQPAVEATPSAHDVQIEALTAELAALRTRVADLEAAPATTVEPPVDASDEPVEPLVPVEHDLVADFLHGLSVTGYLQAQYEWSAASLDQLGPGGAVLNRDRFVIRRARVRLRGEWDAFSLDLEVDGNTTRGPFFGLRRATVGVAWRNPDASVPPYVALAVGLTDIPFGHEVRLGQRDMPFMERTQGSLAFFRGPIDAGARLTGALGPFRYDLAAMTGTPLDDRAGASGIDPTAAPDLIGRIGVESQPVDALTISGGVSFLWGTGFSAGSDAQKARLEWRDLNESGTLDTGEIMVLPARAAVPSVTFEHWAVGADLELGLTTELGRTDVFGEVVMASNLDRALFVADPVVNGADVRELSGYVAVVQSILDWAVVGFRYDYYDPNADLFDQRRGLSVPASAALHTFSPMVGVTLPPALCPGFRARLVVQYDAILDQLARDTRGVPTDFANDQLTVRVQGELR
jgi:hypothetical protein